jgi:hypothetical protein
VGGGAASSSARNAGLYLAYLLKKSYQRRWDRMDYVERAHAVDLHYGAVAHVLAEYLQYHPREGRAGDREILPSQLVPLVSRALRGITLSRQVLEIFIAAFRMSQEHADELRRQWEGTSSVRVVIGDLPPIEGAPAAHSPAYATTSLHEFHHIGPDGQPTDHRTIRDIQSLIDGLATYRYTFDTDRVLVERIHGGTPGQPYHVAGTQWAVDIALPRQLHRGQTHTLEFATRFLNPRFDEPCFRRAAHEPLENVTIWVEFHQDKLPSSIWWTQWKDYRDPNVTAIRLEPFKLDRDHVASQHLKLLDKAVVGFEWQW